MSRQEELLDAGEYVIGTLSAAERAAFEIHMESHATAREDVALWERSLAALDGGTKPVKPSAEVWERVAKAAGIPVTARRAQHHSVLDSEQTKTGQQGPVDRAANVVPMSVPEIQRSRSRWRFGAIAASLLALGLGTYVLNDRYGFAPDLPGSLAQRGDSSRGELYAVVRADGDKPTLLVTVAADRKTVTVREAGIARAEDKSLELWYVPEGEKPVSIGLVGEGDIDLEQLKARPGDLLAVSLEPKGGSPTGVATGPVIYSGTLISSE